MKFILTQLPKSKHTDLVTSVGWTPTNVLYSTSDDKTIHSWNIDGEPLQKIIEVDYFTSDLHWLVTPGAADTDLLALAGCDGVLRLLLKNGRADKVIADAHRGAITSVRWNYEGSACSTSGEDGSIKVWSRTGNLRSKLAQTDRPIYSVVWSPDNQSVLYCSSNFLVIKPLQVSAKQVKWKAHDGIVLKVDWNPINNLIVSGGEDGKYKVWDSFGRQLYSSRAQEFAITSVAWAPNGDYFAVGSFNSIILCDQTGWAYSRHALDSGSILNLSWTADGTHIAAAGGNKSVVFGQIIERKCEWENYVVTLKTHNSLSIVDVLHDGQPPEELDLPDRIVTFSLSHNHLVAVTTKQCYIYHVLNWSTPHIFDVKGTVSLILQAEKLLALVDSVRGITIFNYDGRLLCNPKIAGLRVEFLKAGNITLSGDTLALIDRAKPNMLSLFDVSSGRPLDPFKHTTEIQQVALNQAGLASDRKLAFVDKNRDLFLSPIHRHEPVKLATIVDSIAWHDNTDILSALADQKLIVWYYPNTVFIDQDLLPKTKFVTDASALGRLSQLVSFCSSRVTVRRADGSLHVMMVSPIPAQLHAYAVSSQFAKAVRLCRAVKDPVLWACLAAMSLQSADLETAELALAAIDEVDKLQFIQHIKRVPSQEGRQAELALYRRRPDQAESILLQANPPLLWRALELNLQVHRYERALELAQTHRNHIDTVLYFRQQYLNAMGRKENNKRFLAVMTSAPALNWEAISQKIEADCAAERKRPNAKPVPVDQEDGILSSLGGFGIQDRLSPAAAKPAI